MSHKWLLNIIVIKQLTNINKGVIRDGTSWFYCGEGEVSLENLPIKLNFNENFADKKHVWKNEHQYVTTKPFSSSVPGRNKNIILPNDVFKIYKFQTNT